MWSVVGCPYLIMETATFFRKAAKKSYHPARLPQWSALGWFASPSVGQASPTPARLCKKSSTLGNLTVDG